MYSGCAGIRDKGMVGVITGITCSSLAEQLTSEQWALLPWYHQSTEVQQC